MNDLPLMNIGAILERSLRLMRDCIGRAPQAFFLLCVINFATYSPFWMGSYSGLIGIVQWFFVLPYYRHLSSCWLNKAAESKGRFFCIPLSLYLRALVLCVLVAIVGLAWSICLIIPGLVYLVNRSLALPALMLEDCSISSALRESKFLMTQGRWYELSSPLWRYSGLMLVLLVMNMVLTFSLILGVALLEVWTAQDPRLVSLGLSVGAAVLSAATIYSMTATIGFYHDLRNRYLPELLPGS